MAIDAMTLILDRERVRTKHPDVSKTIRLDIPKNNIMD